MELIKSLSKVGLNEKEARVYIALLQTGKASAYSVAKHSGLKKPTAYVILDELINKGIVKRVPQTKTMHYVAIDPEDLFSIYKSRVINAEKEALPELKALSRGKGYKVKTTYYEGMNGIKEMYNTLHKLAVGREYVGFFAHERDASSDLMEFFNEVNEKHRRLHIKRRGITVADSSLRKYLNKEALKKYDIRIKALPKTMYDSNISIEIVKKHTFIFSHKHLQGIIIDNPDIARVMKQIFEIIWKQEHLFVKLKGKT